MKSLYCEKCGYPAIVVWENDFLFCPRCDGDKPLVRKGEVDWSKYTDQELIALWNLLAELTPNHVWEVEGEMMTREGFRKLLETNNDPSPTPKMSAATPQWLRRILWAVSEQARKNGGVVRYVSEKEG